MKDTIKGVMLAGVFSVMNAHAAVYYLDSTGGDNTKNCLSSDTACKTLAHLLPKSDHGDEIRMAQGTYKIAEPSQAITKAVSINGGYSADFTQRASDAALTIITSDGVAGSEHLLSVNSGVNKWLTFDTLTFGSKGTETTTGSLQIHTEGASWLALNNVIVEGNVMQAGSGAINMAVATDKLKITQSKFINNEGKTANGGAVVMNGGSADISFTTFTGNKAPAGGAISMNGGTLLLTDSSFENNASLKAGGAGSYGGGAINLVGVDATIDRVIFSGNTSMQHGGAVMLDTNTTATLQNATFYANTVGGANDSRGGAIAQVNSQLNLYYSTLYKNQVLAGGTTQYGGALAVWGDIGTTDAHLFGNLFLDNTVDAVQSNIATKGITLVDKGSNILGYAVHSDAGDDGLWTVATTSPYGVSAADQAGIFGEVLSTTTTLANTDIASIIVDVNGPADNGGTTKSIKIVFNGPAMDKIDSTQADFFGRGKSADYPFLSLQQAHSAMKIFAEYESGTYYFDLDGVDATALDFSTYVNKEGWVLVASGNKTEVTPGAYAKNTALSLRTDSILSDVIVTNTAFIFDEVRINTPAGSAVALDMISNAPVVVGALQAYTVLPNNFSAGKWVASQGGDYIDGATSAAETETLDKAIFDAKGDVDGLRWLPANNNTKENLDLWVRSSSDYCDGTKVTTDGRGLPRSNFINPNDIHQADDKKACDIGAFEYNNGYQLDCHDEDGLRHENNYDLSGTGEVDVNICFGGDLSKATPKSLLDNIGAIHPVFYLFLLSIAGLRLRRK